MSRRAMQVEQATGVREWLNRHPRWTLAIMATVVLAATAAIVLQLLASRQRYPAGLPSAYFSADDGKTWFTAGMENVPPFDHDGQPAVRAYVFQCGSAKPYVAYLERYVPASHKAMVEHRATPQDQIAGRELKVPGQTAWVKSSDRKASAAIADVRCPGGGQPEPLEP